MTKYLLDTQPGLVLVLAETTGSDTTRYIHSSRGIHMIQDASENWHSVNLDGLGSVRNVVDAAGEVLSAHNYTPYGVPDSSMTGFAFTGEQRDSNGLQYHRARYYAPELGLWASLDPLETDNRYAYVSGDPVNFVDPSGLCLDTSDNCNQFYGIQGNAYEQCVSSELAKCGVQLIYSASSLNNLMDQLLCDLGKEVINGCIPLRNATAFNSEQIRSVYNAFKIFDRGFRNGDIISNASVKKWWPLNNNTSVRITKTIDIGRDATAAAQHHYPVRVINLRDNVWGEVDGTIHWQETMPMQSEEIRAWIVLHEFLHIFVKDLNFLFNGMPTNYAFFEIDAVNWRIPSFVGLTTQQGQNLDYNVARGFQRTISTIIGRIRGNDYPTWYACGNDEEYFIEAITGVFWDAGYLQVGYTPNAGGRTSFIRDNTSYKCAARNQSVDIRNVNDIQFGNASLRNWAISIINNGTNE